MVVASTPWAAEVSPEQAQAAVRKWISLGPKRMDAEFRSSDAEVPKTVRNKAGRAVYHAVNLKDGGFVVTSGDTRLSAIVAFSATGRFGGDESGPFHALLQKDLAGAVSALERADRKVAAASASSESGTNPYAAAMAEWGELLPAKPKSVSVAEGDRSVSAGGSRKTSVSDVRVSKLLKTEWGQVGDYALNSSTQDYDYHNVFNYYTPKNYPCGCVATAGAQIMKRWQRPKHSISQFSNKCIVNKKTTTRKSIAGAFDWGNMFLTWDRESPAPPVAQIKAVGKLTYNIAVALGTEWGQGFGSASPSDLINVLKTRFGYKSGTFVYHDIDALNASKVDRQADFTERVADFNNALYASLDAKMPVILSIIDKSTPGIRYGHAVVADGYGYTSGKRYTHLNFGWYGEDDAWYCLVNEALLIWEDTGNYSEFEGIGFNIHPTASGDVISGRVLDATGYAVSGATVRLYDSSNNEKGSATSDSKGIYSFRITAKGRYTVRASHAKTDESPSRAVSISVLSADGTYGEGGRTGNKWGVDVKFAEWSISDSPTLVLKPSSSSRGTVSGGGKYATGKKATIKAKAKSGNAFVGWFKNKACTKKLNPAGYDNRKPTIKILMPAESTTIYAKFVSKASDKKSLKFSSATKELAKTAAKATAGEEFSLKLGISSASLPTVTAKVLPDGLSIDTTTGEITGTPTKPGSYTATVTVKSAAGNKITQKVKFKVLVPSWAKGTFYGKALPGGTNNPPASLTFTVGSTGKVSGKVTYEGKAYSFTSACASCTDGKATFKPQVEIGSSTFKPGTVTIKNRALTDDLSVAEGTNSKHTFMGLQKANLLKKDGKLAELIGRTFSFTKEDDGSDLPNDDDKLDVLLSSGDSVEVSGTVGGETLTALSVPLLVVDASLVVIDEGTDTESHLTKYWLAAYIFDATLKYYKTLAVMVDIGDSGAVVNLAAKLQ